MRTLIVVVMVLLSMHEAIGQRDTAKFDPLLLKEVVISDYTADIKLKVPMSLSSIDRPADLQLQGVASALAQIPGVFSDASTGEVFTRVYARGISLSAEDDIGWYYMSLQEDGMPITAVQYNQFSPDFFLRPDVSHKRMEVIKGGKSSILAPSGPGGIVNFISEPTPFGKYQTHDRLTAGVYANGRPYLRLEGFSGGQIGSSDWSYDFGYMYRHDRGPRQLDYATNNGGQLKASLRKNIKKGIITLKIKSLNDRVNRYTGVAATNWEDPTPAFGQSFQNTTLLPPGIEGGTLADPRTYDGSSIGTYDYDPSRGINAKENSAMLALDLQLGEWRLTDKLKYSNKSLNWQTVIGGQPLPLDDFITYFVSGDPFPIGNVTFRDVASGQPLASVNNEGAFGVFQGFPPSFQYTEGSLPNDAILGSGTWYKDDQINEWMNQLLLQRSFENVDLNLGLFLSRSAVDILTTASFLYATYEPQPRLLSAQITGPDGVTRSLSDANGLSNPGGLFYEAADINASQVGLFGDADIKLAEDLSLNVGLRYERIGHSGTKDRSAPGDNIGTLVKSGEDDIDANYSYLNYSLALDYNISEQVSTFVRYSLGHKAPELNYYINNFTNQEIPPEAPPAQSIGQLEIGIKQSAAFTSLTATAFLSNLSDVAYSNFVFDDMTNQIFYTPTQFNSSRTIGIELEWGAVLTDDLTFNISATWQSPKLTEFTLYNANESIDTADDDTADFSDNAIPHNPKLMGRAQLNYNKNDWFAGIGLNYIGSRYGNIENAFTLPAYSTIDADLGYAINDKYAIGLRAKNLLNTAGLANFFGPNSFGSNSDAASTSFIQNNPEASFVVFPIMPRAIYLSVDYTF